MGYSNVFSLQRLCTFIISLKDNSSHSVQTVLELLLLIFRV